LKVIQKFCCRYKRIASKQSSENGIFMARKAKGKKETKKSAMDNKYGCH